MERLHSEDPSFQCSRISHCGKIISFQCKQASGTNEGELEFCCFLFKKESSRLLKAAHGAAVICKKTSSCHLDIVKCKCAADFRKKVSSACVLVTRRSVKGENFKYSLFTLSSPDYRPRLCFEFKLPYEIKGDVSILQGPTVLWRHAENVFYKSLQAGEVRQIPAKMSHSVVAEPYSCQGQIFVLGVQSKHFQTPNKTMAYIVQNGQEFEFDGAQMLPHPYISITQCILVLSAEKVDNILKSTVVAATSYQQLVLFLNGTVKDVCALPFEKAEEIQLVNTGRNGCLFVVSFHQGHVCALWKETFQVCNTGGLFYKLSLIYVFNRPMFKWTVFHRLPLSGQASAPFMLMTFWDVEQIRC